MNTWSSIQIWIPYVELLPCGHYSSTRHKRYNKWTCDVEKNDPAIVWWNFDSHHSDIVRFLAICRTKLIWSTSKHVHVLQNPPDDEEDVKKIFLFLVEVFWCLKKIHSLISTNKHKIFGQGQGWSYSLFFFLVSKAPPSYSKDDLSN